MNHASFLSSVRHFLRALLIATLLCIGVDAHAQPSGTVALYRYYDPHTADHFYTTNYSELGAGIQGWRYEGVAGYVYATQHPGTVPLYRYYDGRAGDHFYTTNYAELEGGRGGYAYEGVAAYVFPGEQRNTTGANRAAVVPLHRYMNPGATDHFYTTVYAELGAGAGGYVYEGIACWIYAPPPPSAAPAPAPAPERPKWPKPNPVATPPSCPLVRAEFCLWNPSSPFGCHNEPITSTACTYQEARLRAQALASNWTLTDGPCTPCQR